MDFFSFHKLVHKAWKSWEEEIFCNKQKLVSWLVRMSLLENLYLLSAVIVRGDHRRVLLSSMIMQSLRIVQPRTISRDNGGNDNTKLISSYVWFTVHFFIAPAFTFCDEYRTFLQELRLVTAWGFLLFPYLIISIFCTFRSTMPNISL